MWGWVGLIGMLLAGVAPALEEQTLEPAPCSEVTDSCLEEIETKFLRGAGTLGIVVEPFLDPGSPALLRVAEVKAGGPAEGLGIQPGDWIVSWDGLALVGDDAAIRTERFQKYLVQFHQLKQGDRVQLEISSGKEGSKRAVAVVAGAADLKLARRKLVLELWRRYGLEWATAYRSFLLRRGLISERDLPLPEQAPPARQKNP